MTVRKLNRLKNTEDAEGVSMTKSTEHVLQAAKRAVVQVGHGRGFIVSAGEARYIITAAHCLPQHPEPHLGNGITELTYRNILGRLGTTRRTIWAELAADDVASDVAVFAEPDNQDLDDQCRRYRTFTRSAIMFGRLPPQQHPSINIWNAPGTPAFVLLLNGEWQTCSVHNRGGRFLWITESNYIRSGMSGSPIIDQT